MDQYDVNGRMVRGRQLTLKASGAQTASTNGGAVDTGPDGGSLLVQVDITAASGTAPTLLVAVQGSQDGTNWVTLGSIGANGYVAGTPATEPTNFTGTAAAQKGVFPRLQYVRYASTVGGTTPSFTYKVTAVAC